MNNVNELIKDLPKTELHLHIEGTFEPELMFEIAARNNIEIPYNNVAELKAAYNFRNLEDFINIYMQGTKVLQQQQDFYDLTFAYLQRIHADNVVHTEIFFAPQLHTTRGIEFATVLNGISAAMEDGHNKFGISYRLIPCFLRHLSEDSANDTLDHILRHKDKIAGIGLESVEVDNPPQKFSRVFAKAREHGLAVVAHAGEEGPASYIWQALQDLKVQRIDHGVRAIDDIKLLDYLKQHQVPLTMCPLSNVKLRVFDNMQQHNALELMQQGLLVTINSDDPAYFGGYVNDNYYALAEALKLSFQQVTALVKNGFKASLLSEAEKQNWLQQIDEISESYIPN